VKGSRARLLRWYEPRRRAYPWRSRPTPYRVLVSEFMLQQTQAPRVVPAFRAFVRRFPSVAALAAAPRRDVVSAWSGLGYNRRAVSLHDAARLIVADHSGRIPRDADVLQKLPGVGPYTASAVASVAFGEPESAVDTNVRRIVSRVHFGVDTGDVAERDVDDAARRWLDPSDPGAWNQALMDLGREVCRPAPRCDQCPLAGDCAFRSSGAPARAPATRRMPKMPCRNAICARCVISTRFAARRSSRGSSQSCVTFVAANSRVDPASRSR
jgi:A/G-specific adenine glycosylase